MGGQVVTGQRYLHASRKSDVNGGVGSTDEALGAIAGEEWFGTSSFVWLEYVNLSLEVTSDFETVGFS